MMIEQLVLAKTYFDREGLIVALDDDRPVGFVHAGFGPNQAESCLDYDLGVTSLLLVVAHLEQAAIMGELLTRSEAYLRSRGAKVLYGGGIRPLNPFYWGLYGGSELPGVLDSDADLQALFRSRDYREIDRTLVFHRELMSFRPQVDRQQMQIRRGTEIQTVDEPAARNWWDASAMNCYDRTKFELRQRGDVAPIATATFWNMELFANRGVRTQGLFDVEVAPGQQRKGIATYLLGDAMRQLQEQGVSVIEAQTNVSNTAAVAMYRKLGFQQVDSGAVFRKNHEIAI